MTGDTRGWKTSPHFFTTSKLLLWRRSSGLGPVCLGQTRVVTLQGVTAFYASWRKTVRSGQRGWKKKNTLLENTEGKIIPYILLGFGAVFLLRKNILPSVNHKNSTCSSQSFLVGTMRKTPLISLYLHPKTCFHAI